VDVGFSYVGPLPDRQHAAIYAPPGWEAPPSLILRSPQGKMVTFARLSDRTLECVNPEHPGRCDSYDCHRTVPGQCQCGRHPNGVPIQTNGAGQ
jgi:hypothetical protein